MLLTLVLYETTRLEYKVEADSVEAALEAFEPGPDDSPDEECLGTDGVEEVLLNGRTIWAKLRPPTTREQLEEYFPWLGSTTAHDMEEAGVALSGADVISQLEELYASLP